MFRRSILVLVFLFLYSTIVSAAGWVLVNVPVVNPQQHQLLDFYSNGSRGIVIPIGEDAIRTTNSGKKWSNTTSGGLYRVTGTSDTILAVAGAGAFRTTDFGLTWETVVPYAGRSFGGIAFINGTRIAVAPTITDIFRTTDCGTTWTSTPSPIQPYLMANAVAGHGSTVIIVGEDGLLLRSGDAGVTWLVINSGTNSSLYDVSLVDSLRGYIVGRDGTYLITEDSGISWTIRPPFTTKHLSSIVVDREFGIAIGIGEVPGARGAIFVTTDKGTSWGMEYTMSLDTIIAWVKHGFGTYYAGGNWGKLLRRDTTLVTVSEIQFPTGVTLVQTYPNPFNRQITLSYVLSSVSDVNITIYDILGRQVAVVLNKKQSVGEQRVVWDTRGLPSGMYVYVLQTNGEVRNGRMLLVR